MLCIVAAQDEGDKLIVVERGELVFVFNFHPVNSYTDYRVGALSPGSYKVGSSSTLLQNASTEHCWLLPNALPGRLAAVDLDMSCCPRICSNPCCLFTLRRLLCVGRSTQQRRRAL